MNRSIAMMRPSFRKPIWRAPAVRARAADVGFLFAADPHHHGRVGFFESSAGMAIERAPGILLPNPPPLYSLMKMTCAGSTPTHRATPPTGRAHALRRAVKIQLAVLPVRHRAARFHRLMAGGLQEERFVEDQRGVLEPGLQIAVRPFSSGLSRRQLPAPAPSKSSAVH